MSTNSNVFHPAAAARAAFRPRIVHAARVEERSTLTPMVLGLWLYVALEYIRPEVALGGSNFQILRVLSILLAGGLAMSALMGLLESGSAPQGLFLLGFLVMVPVSLLLSGKGDAAWYARGAFTEFGKTVVMYFVCTNIITTRSRLKLFLTLAQLLTLYLAIGGIVVYLTGTRIQGFSLESTGRLRYAGIFEDANDFAQLLLVGLALMLNRAIWTEGKLSRAFWGMGAALVALAVTFTASRGGILGILVLVVVSLSRAKGRFKALVITGILGLVLIAAMPGMARERLMGTTTEEESAHGRIEAWTQGWYMFWSHPLTGVGYSEFREYARMTAHNSLVLVSAETGAPGIFCWIAMFYLTFRMGRLVTTLGRGSPDYLVSATFDALVAYLCTAWFLSRAYIFLPYFLISLGVSAAYVVSHERDIEWAKISSLGLTDLARVGGMLILWMFVWKLNLVAGWSL